MKPKSPRIRQTQSTALPNGPKNVSPRAPYTKSLVPGTLQKRRSITQRSPKKKNNGVFDKKNNEQLLGKIPPGGLLTPSSSDTSLTTAVSRSGQRSCLVMPKVMSLPKQPTAPTPYLTLKRQQTAAMINFQARKSVSQMDFKEARRTGNYQLVAHVPAPGSQDNHQTAAEAGLDASMSKLLLQDAALMSEAPKGRVSFVVSPDQDARVASLKIFNTIILHAWRKRRQSVRNITEQFEDQKKILMKTRNQLHLYTSLFSVEQRRNGTLNDQLRQSYREAADTKLSYEELHLQLAKIKSEKQQLDEQLKQKDQQIKNLKEVQQSLNSELFRANADQREHLQQIAQLQRDYQESLGIQREQASDLELVQIEIENSMKLIKEIHQEMAKTEALQSNSEQKYNQLLDHTKQLEHSAQEMKEQLALLQSCLAVTMGQRIRQCLAQRQMYQQATYRMLHFVADYVLPGNPPPPSIPQAIKMIKDLLFTKVSGEAKDENQDEKSIDLLNESVDNPDTSN
ncbi:uncharacterized protein LOC111073497 [Drosophila obscura]|uniref:uncharacterized protein LOC111073497 n=1 Tax=Drosophila obscura TaxID=7282 RepID=UPI001BB233A0|nr:uncharacterized protein LOC111073497 [Drosophila obscura]